MLAPLRIANLGEDVRDVVITVPAYFGLAERRQQGGPGRWPG